MVAQVVVRREKLWQSSFRLLFASRFAKVLADNFASIAFVWLLLEMGGGATATAVLFACTMVPQVVLSTLVSPLLSKGRLTQWMFASDIVRAVIGAAVPLLALGGMLPIWLFFVMVLVHSATGAFYTPASVAILPRIVRDSQLQEANALLQSSQQIVTLAGLAGAGVLITLLSTTTTLLLTSGVFVLSAVLLVGVRERVEERPQETAVQKEAGETYWGRVREGFRIVRQHRLLFALNAYAVFLNFGITPWIALAPVFVAEDLQGDADMLTLLRGSAAVGALLAGIWLAKVKVRRHGLLFLAAGTLQGATLVFMGAFDWLWVVAAAAFVFGACMSLINVPEMVIIQTTVPQHQQAQVFSVIMTMSIGFLPLASLLAGALAETWGTQAVMIGGGLLVILSGVVTRMVSSLAAMKVEEAK